MSNFIVADRQTDYLLPPSVDDWLNQDHLARFIVEVIDQLDLSKLTRQYAGRGSKAYHPATLLAILVYGYATGVFSSRRLEQATYDSVAFRFLAANRHPDHDSLAAFRRRFLDELSDLFLQVLEMAKEMKVLKVGNICLDGTKIEANASRHSALSHGYIEKLEVQLKGEIQELLALAEQADRADIPNGVSLPEELKRREDRLAAMAAAKATIVARAKERDQREKAEYDEKMACRAAKEKATGKKPGGKPPRAPEPGPRDKDQLNLTDEESRILPVAGGGFEQAYNAQAAADAATMLIVATGVTQAPNDKQQVEPMLATLKAQAVVLGAVECLIADSGYCSEKNIKACEAAGIDPLIAVARDEHHPGWRERHSEPAALPDNATPVQAMSHRLKTQAGRARYALRKQTIEPVFGIIKSVMGFRRFSLRGLNKVTGEWTLVCMAWNLKRLAVLRLQ
ncbi:MAG: IS1182 family transposase [Candidatus Accumulibacter sp.]|jgi:transposase|uniref:IS1182 family transposase n=1 Tax=unclassified Candidatus Accumulibacter TaxID=2619054 RepID=UPI001A36D6A8|nr:MULTISPECIES: IS1182 family transposase [unclassified Candidatus Accumulibacter]MBL8367232.1 IS1182 family transposase [Accumulibacter sp.]HRE73036.1 IS1182 family transposase [Accumulibacter sp.]